MKKSAIATLICISSLLLVLSGSSPKLIGEEEAKKAGLAFINHAFDVEESEAEVEYQQAVGESYKNGTIVQYGTEEPRLLYNIRVDKLEDGNYRYYATVNARTGSAFRAVKNPENIVLTKEQEAQAAAIGKEEDLPIEAFEDEEQSALNAAEEFVRARFEPDVPVLSTVLNSSMTDSEIFPQVYVNGFVVFVDGTIYSVQICWPSMQVTDVVLCNQEY